MGNGWSLDGPRQALEISFGNLLMEARRWSGSHKESTTNTRIMVSGWRNAAFVQGHPVKRFGHPPVSDA